MLFWLIGVSKNLDVDLEESLMGVEYDLSWIFDKDINFLFECIR